MIQKKYLKVIALTFFMLVIFTACGIKKENSPVNPSQAIREGYAAKLPQNINKIISIGPSNTEILIGLGFGGRIIAADDYSSNIPGLSPNTPAKLDILSLDAEYIINLMPDIIFITDIAKAGTDDDPLAAISALGITVIYMPSSSSIAGIMEDIQFIAAVMDANEAGENLVYEMQTEIEKIKQTAAAITEKRKVYFEISAAPWMYSFGTGTFLNELIELTGAENVFKDHNGWISVSDESLLAANPDVILTSVDYIENPTAEIMGRPGFNIITAVQNGNVIRIDTASSNRPSQNITRALNEIALAVYPEYYR